MIQSQFRFSAYLLLLLALFIIGLSTVIIWEVVRESSFSAILIYLLTLLGLVFIGVWVFLGELRTKAISLEIEGNSIQSKNFYGLGRPQKYNMNDFEGYIIASLESENGVFEYLYLIQNKRKVIKISEFYHKNYSEMKTLLSQKLRFMGEEPFELVREFKELFEGLK